MNERPSASARSVALEALLDVETKGAFAGIALDRRLADAPGLSVSERSFAAELAYGTIRWQKHLDWAIDRLIERPASLAPLGRCLLRLGLYQLLFVQDIPPHAAVYETVALANRAGRRGLAKLVNWGLREHLRRGGEVPLPPETDLVRHLSVRYSHPEWLVERWLARWGRDRVEQALRADNAQGPIIVRTNRLRTTRDSLINRLKSEGVTAEPVPVVPEGVILSAPGLITNLPSFREGLFTVQDTASMLVGHVVGPTPGETVLDACAAPGGKTTHLAELMKDDGRVIAADLHQNRLNLVGEAARRLGLRSVRLAPVDARHLPRHREMLGLGADGPGVDRALVDAPCSGLGVLRRRPDLRWRKTEDEVEKLPALQKAILEAAASLVRPGGTIVYSTCTTEPEENDEVVLWFLSRHPDFRLESPAFALDGTMARFLDGDFLRIIPGQYDWPWAPDGFFAARMVRQS